FTQPTMQYQDTTAAGTAPRAPTILLQRLACPYLPPQANPAMPFYNPYITVDYMQNVDGNGAVPPLVVSQNSKNNLTTGAPNPTTGMHSEGRPQPSFGNRAPKPPTTIVPPPPAPDAQHPFNALNNQAPNSPAGPGNFSWPVHLDRQLASPMDL